MQAAARAAVMGEVRNLEVAARPVNQDAVDLVEGTLARVRAGEVVAVAIVEVRVAGNVAATWSRTGHYHALNSGCARLAAKIALVEDE